jgi:hypothetical protein
LPATKENFGHYDAFRGWAQQAKKGTESSSTLFSLRARNFESLAQYDYIVLEITSDPFGGAIVRVVVM